MSQVLAITSETDLITPEQNLSRTSYIDFEKMLEEERQKAILPLIPQLNFQSFFNIAGNFDSKLDESVNKIDAGPRTDDYSHKDTVKFDHADDKKPNALQKHEEAAAPEKYAAQTKADQIKTSNNAINRIFAGEIELSSEFYNIMLTTKNRTPSLRSIDLDDLVSQIQDRIKFLKDNGKIELILELKPENLGSITMNISSNKGLISINIFAGIQARSALEENLGELERSLKLANLNIEKLSVVDDGKREHNSG